MAREEWEVWSSARRARSEVRWDWWVAARSAVLDEISNRNAEILSVRVRISESAEVIWSWKSTWDRFEVFSRFAIDFWWEEVRMVIF